jgi:iron complex outermembrane recepter protein
MKNALLLGVYLMLGLFVAAQSKLSIRIADKDGFVLQAATVELLRKDSSLVKMQVADSLGTVVFSPLQNEEYLLRVSAINHTPFWQRLTLPASSSLDIRLLPAQALDNVTIQTRKPLVELQPGKTVVNIENSITQIGSTVMEALEKLPGVIVDKDGNISLKGRSGVTIMLDGRPTYVNGAELATLLNSMSAANISQIELIDQPPARFDAAGNAGIINIKTKKITQRGFYGTATASLGQGVYPKNNNSLQLNYRSGKWNLFANYSLNINRNFINVPALRTYLQADEKTVIAQLDQHSYSLTDGVTHNLRTGVDVALGKKTNTGLVLNGLSLSRYSTHNNRATWLNPQGRSDSAIATNGNNTNKWKNWGANLNFRHVFNARNEVSADVDWIGYRIRASQIFENSGLFPRPYVEASKGNLPSDLNIFSAKADYQLKTGEWNWESGLKMSRINTDNLADFYLNDGSGWVQDWGRTNRFLYNEKIYAAYLSTSTQLKKLTIQAGLRYEQTVLDAKQTGNPTRKDSSFSRIYDGFFPTVALTVAADSNHSFSLSAGRRIDRPPFQKLNPFQVFINKYTYHQGNAFFRPQYTWNFELSHSYKNVLLTGLSYSVTTDYFSQFFPIESNGIVIYTEGNLTRLQVLGLSVGTQLQPARWWSLSAQAVLNHRIMEGFIGRQFNEAFTQYNFNLNNQFRLPKGWGAELTGFYTSRGRNDIQEIVDPAGQLSVGVSKNVLRNKGTLRLAVRDIFYTQWMKGFTYFQQATEWFKLTRDTRVVTLSFTYRFGTSFKSNKRTAGAAKEEMERMGSGQ